jgi:hypothetical protein
VRPHRRPVDQCLGVPVADVLGFDRAELAVPERRQQVIVEDEVVVLAGAGLDRSPRNVPLPPGAPTPEYARAVVISAVRSSSTKGL